MHTLLREKKEITAWLDKYEVQDYLLIKDSQYGFVVNVDGHVNLSEKGLTSIDVKFNYVDGIFDCSCNALTSLLGAPHTANGRFDCDENQLTSLLGAPEKIMSGNFFCNQNRLTTLMGAPRSVLGSFSCHNNQLTSLDYSPRAKRLDFTGNRIDNLDGVPDSGAQVILVNNPKLGEYQTMTNCAEIRNRWMVQKEKELLDSGVRHAAHHLTFKL